MGYLLLSSLFILRKLSSQLSLCPIWTYFFHLVFFSLSSSDLPVLHLPSLYLLPLCPLSLVCTFAFFLLFFFSSSSFLSALALVHFAAASSTCNGIPSLYVYVHSAACVNFSNNHSSCSAGVSCELSRTTASFALTSGETSR